MTTDLNYTNTFIRYNYEDEDEMVEVYHGELELYNETTQFYHNTFADEEDYDIHYSYLNGWWLC